MRPFHFYGSQVRLAAWLLLCIAIAANTASTSARAQPLPITGFQPILSPNARSLAYTDSIEGVLNVFVLDLASGVSRRVSALPNGGAVPKHHSYKPHFLGAAPALLFESLSPNLVPADVNDRSDLFIHQWETSQTESITLRYDGIAAAGSAQNALVSDDGQWIAFTSDSTQLLPQGRDSFSFPKVYLYNTQNRSLLFASTNRLGRGPLGFAALGGLSSDGQRLLFRCETNDIARLPITGVTTLWYWRDTTTGLNSMVRLRTNGTATAIAFECHALSGDGRFAVGSFSTPIASSGFTPAVYRISLDTNSAAQGPALSTATSIPLSTPRFNAIHDIQVSHDGSKILISGFLRTNSFVSTQRGALLWEPDVPRMVALAPPNDPASTSAIHSATLSPRGNRIAFVHASTGFWVTDTAGRPIFGPVQTGDFPAPAFSGDERWLVFQSPSPTATPNAPGYALFLIDLNAAAVPSLTLQRDGDKFVILWKAQIENLALEFADSVTAGGWQKIVPTQPGRFEFTPSDTTLRIFRLTLR